MSRPGFMVYLENSGVFHELSDAQAGRLIKQMFNYVEHGTEPDNAEELVLRVLWPLIKNRLDADADHYAEMCMQNKYKVYRRECKKTGTTPKEYDQWLAEQPQISADNSGYPEIVRDNCGYPTSTPTTATSTARAETPKVYTHAYGEYQHVKLTDAQYARLIDELGQVELDRCIAYVDESAQSNGNKNKWKDWNLVIRKCHREQWGVNRYSQRDNSTAAMLEDSYGMMNEWAGR